MKTNNPLTAYTVLLIGLGVWLVGFQVLNAIEADNSTITSDNVIATADNAISSDLNASVLYLLQASVPTKNVKINGIDFQVEVAQTDEARARGLMYRQALAPGHGMLFVFPQQERLAPFWMKNTYFPLDVIWVNHAGTVVSIFENAQPQSERLMTSFRPARYVIELPAGTVRQHKIIVGDRVQL